MKSKDAQRFSEVVKACSGMGEQNLMLLLAYAKGLEIGQITAKAQQKRGKEGTP